MDGKGKSRLKATKRSSGIFKAVNRLPTKFVKDCGFIPIILINTAALIEKHIKTKEIFQTQGTLSKAYATLNQLSNGRRFRMNRNLTVHDAVEAMKLVLTSLPEPLIPEDVCDSLITASRENSADQYGSILVKFRMKSPVNFGILHFMMILLKKVSLHTQHNLMDVRKLATIFVLDVIKPLKLDDPNDGKFLSERMQRLPYLIMVIEKLILNVNIFRTARKPLKPGAPHESASDALSELVLVRGVGSGDCRQRGAERASPNVYEPSRCTLRDVTSPTCARTTCVRQSATPSSVTFAGQPLVETIKQTSPAAMHQSNLAQTSKSVTSFGKCDRCENARCLVGPVAFLPTMNSGTNRADPHMVLESSIARPQLRDLSSKVPFPTDLEICCPKFRSRPSTTSNLTGPKACVPYCILGQVRSKTKSPNAQFVLLSPGIKINSLKASVKGNDNERSDEKKKQSQGRRLKAKADSLPPLTRLGRIASGYGVRNSSLTTSLERRGSSPKKKTSVIKSKVNSIRDGRVNVARTVVKRRSSSAGIIDTGLQLNRSTSQGRRKRKLSLCRKRSGESASDKITALQDEIISPWNDEGMTSDDTSLMKRTIRNPRILPVPASIPSSPETAVSNPWPSHQSRSRERRSRRSFSKSARISPYPPTSTVQLPKPSGEFQFRDHEQPAPLILNLSNHSMLPSEKSDTFEGRTSTKSTSMVDLVRQPTEDKPASLTIHTGCVNAKKQEERAIQVESLDMRSVDQLDACDKKKVCSKGAKCLISQAAATDSTSPIPFYEKPKHENKTKEVHHTIDYTLPVRSSLKPMKEATVESHPMDPPQEYSSVEFASLSSSQITSEVPSTSKPTQNKIIVLQQQTLPLRRVTFHDLRQFRLQNQRRPRQLNGSGKGSKWCTVYNCLCSLSISAVLSFIGFYLHQNFDV